MLRVQPGREAPVTLPKSDDAAGVLDDGVDLEAVPHDAGVSQQPRALALSVGGYSIHIEAVEGGPEVVALLENCQPREPGLMDLQCKALEEGIVPPQGKAVFAVVIGTVNGMISGDRAIASEESPARHRHQILSQQPTGARMAGRGSVRQGFISCNTSPSATGSGARTISMRRFFWRSSSVSLSLRGRYSENAVAPRREGSIPPSSSNN